MALFKDHGEAGRGLAARLESYTGRDNVIVLATPPGGIPVGEALAEALQVEFGIFPVLTLLAPGNLELVLGALTPGGIKVLNMDAVQELNLTDGSIDNVVSRSLDDLKRLELEVYGGHPAPDVHGRTVILVDESLKETVTLHAAALAVRDLEAGKVIAAAPIATLDACQSMNKLVDEVVCLQTFETLPEADQWFEDGSAIEDLDAQELFSEPGRKGRRKYGRK